MTEPKLALSPSITDYFEEVVTEVVEARRIEASPGAVRYVVAMLSDFAHPQTHDEAALTQPVTLLLREALQATGAERFRRLRSLGDGVLYSIGFFGERLEQRGVARDYYLGVGRTAYDHAASMLWDKSSNKAIGPDVLGELSQKFEKFAEVLSDVADGQLASGMRDPKAVVKVYERWLKTGSTRLAGELGSHGILATKPPRGLN